MILGAIDSNEVATYGGLALVAVATLVGLVAWLIKRSIDANDHRFEKFERQFEKQNAEFLANFKEMATDMKALTHSIIEGAAWRSMMDSRQNDLQAKYSELHQRFSHFINERNSENWKRKEGGQ